MTQQHVWRQGLGRTTQCRNWAFIWVGRRLKGRVLKQNSARLLKPGLDLQGRREQNPPNQCPSLSSQQPSRGKFTNGSGWAGKRRKKRKGSREAESPNGLYFCWSSSSFKEPPRTWRELEFLWRECLSSRLKTIFMSCGC